MMDVLRRSGMGINLEKYNTEIKYYFFGSGAFNKAWIRVSLKTSKTKFCEGTSRPRGKRAKICKSHLD